MGMLLMNLKDMNGNKTASGDTYKLRNQGKDATDSWTSTAVKWSWIIGIQRWTSDSKTR